jgi:ABC-type uncharacterized transport system permease subunit
VRARVGQRLGDIDLAIGLAFATLYGYVASRIAGWIARGLPTHWRVMISTAVMLIASIAVSAAGVLAGELGVGLVELFRLGTTHMSYRAEQLPWGQQRVELFLAGIAVFALMSYRARSAAVVEAC